MPQRCLGFFFIIVLKTRHIAQPKFLASLESRKIQKQQFSLRASSIPWQMVCASWVLQSPPLVTLHGLLLLLYPSARGSFASSCFSRSEVQVAQPGPHRGPQSHWGVSASMHIELLAKFSPWRWYNCPCFLTSGAVSSRSNIHPCHMPTPSCQTQILEAKSSSRWPSDSLR